jgi:hypothetical protein
MLKCSTNQIKICLKLIEFFIGALSNKLHIESTHKNRHAPV